MKYIFRDGIVLEFSYDGAIHIDSYELKEGEHWVTSKEEPHHHFVVNKNGEITNGLGGWRPELVEYKEKQKILPFIDIADMLPKGSKTTIDGVTYTKDKDGIWYDKQGNRKTIKDNEITNIVLGKWKLPKLKPVTQNEKVVDTPKLNIDTWADEKERIEGLQNWLAENGAGYIELKKVKSMYQAVRVYTATKYKTIRNYEETGCNKEGNEAKWYKECANYIDVAPKYKGALYRGTKLTPKELKDWENGQIGSFKGIASFDKRQGVGDWYAKKGNKQGIPVVFVTDEGIHRATAIEHISASSGEMAGNYYEQEALFHPETKFKYKSSEMKDGIIYIHIEEIR